MLVCLLSGWVNRLFPVPSTDCNHAAGSYHLIQSVIFAACVEHCVVFCGVGLGSVLLLQMH